jgi:hypothetical protein
MRSRLLILLAVLAIFASVPLSIVYSTRQHMADFRTHIQPGMSVADLVRFAGQPAKIVHPGERLGLASHHFQQASLDAHTVLYAYPKEGFPYYNVFVFVDTDKNVVSSCTIEKL